MPRIKAPTLSLQIGDKIVEVKKPSKRNFELSRALIKPEEFKKFAADPKGFASNFDLKIDNDISTELKTRLNGIGSLDDLNAVIVGPNPINPVGATLWAVAVGVYSITSTKVAVAF